jgi:hypothetical protein
MNKIVDALRELVTALEKHQSLLCVQAGKARGNARAALAEYDAAAPLKWATSEDIARWKAEDMGAQPAAKGGAQP